MNNLTEKELNLDLKTIFFGEEIPALSFEREDDEIRLDLCESGISFDNTGCNGTPFILCSYEIDDDDDEIVDLDFTLYFSGDNCPENEGLDEDMTLSEAIELAKEKYLEFQKEEIDEIFEGLDENEDDEYDFQDYEGYYIELISDYNSGELSEELTKYFDEKMKEYNVSEVDWDYNCFGNKTVYIKLNA